MHPVSSHMLLPGKMDQTPESVRSPRTALYPARSGRKSDPDRPPIQRPCRPLHPHTQATSADRLPHLSPPASSSPSSVRHHMPHSQQPPSLLSHSLTIPNAPHRVGTWISFPQFQKMEFPDIRTRGLPPPPVLRARLLHFPLHIPACNCRPFSNKYVYYSKFYVIRLLLIFLFIIRKSTVQKQTVLFS